MTSHSKGGGVKAGVTMCDVRSRGGQRVVTWQLLVCGVLAGITFS